MNQIIPLNLHTQAERVLDTLDIREASRQDYKYRIPLFLNFTQSQSQHFGDINSFKQYLELRGLLDFKRQLEQRVSTAATKNKYLDVARVFMKELHRQGYFQNDPTQNVKRFEETRGHKRFGLTENEVQAVAEYIRSLPQSVKSSRLRIWFCLLALQGLRQIEIVRLDVEDIKDNYLMVQGKGKDDKKAVLMAPETLQALQEYLSQSGIATGALFRSLGNRQSERITTRTIKREFQDVFIHLGIAKTVHGFRHFYATHGLTVLPVHDVAKFTRHASLETVRIYDDEQDLTVKAGLLFNSLAHLKVTV